MSAMVSSFTPPRSACGTWAYHSYCARQNFAVSSTANSESRGGTAVLKRQWPPSCCVSSPKTGACRKTANGPRIPVLPPRGPERIEASNAPCAGVSSLSVRMGKRGAGIFLAGLFADFVVAFFAGIDFTLREFGAAAGQARYSAPFPACALGLHLMRALAWAKRPFLLRVASHE